MTKFLGVFLNMVKTGLKNFKTLSGLSVNGPQSRVGFTTIMVRDASTEAVAWPTIGRSLGGGPARELMRQQVTKKIHREILEEVATSAALGDAIFEV